MNGILSSQVIVGTGIEYIPESNTHRIGLVVNRFNVQIFPSVVINDVLVKLLLESEDLTIEIECRVLDPDGRIVFRHLIPNMKNKRLDEMLPGFDVSFNARYMISHPGNYNYIILINNNQICEYPIYISS